MNPLLEQFLSESREVLQGIGEKLMQLEQVPGDADLMNELFRFVHTLKGNSGLFELPEMIRVLHAGEDLMDAVRNGSTVYSQSIADQLLEATDFIGLLCDELDAKGRIESSHAADSISLADGLRALITCHVLAEASCDALGKPSDLCAQPPLADIPETIRMDAFRLAQDGHPLHWLAYTPEEECFFQGADPLLTVRQTPGLLWGGIKAREPWSPLAELNAYRCILDFHLLTESPREELLEHYRYMLEQVVIAALDPLSLVIPQGDSSDGPTHEDFVSDALLHLEAGDLAALRQAAQTMLELSSPDLWLSSALRWLVLLADHMSGNLAAMRALLESLRFMEPPDWTCGSTSPAGATITSQANEPPHTASLLEQPPMPFAESAHALVNIFDAQRLILALDDHPPWQAGRFKAVAEVLVNCCKAAGNLPGQSRVEAALDETLATGDGAPLLAALNACQGGATSIATPSPAVDKQTADIPPAAAPMQPVESSPPPATRMGFVPDTGSRFGRRAEDSVTGPIKVAPAKVDRLMNLIGEMVVSKNALPYLAQRAENQYGTRELAREIKAQYAVINRIAEEMQDAIMQVCMRPVSDVFQRFTRLVRDTSRKLGKEVQLVLEGEDTEADKNIIESLADPLVHIVRNSLDHGLESPEVRRTAGKSPAGTLTIRASQESDRVLLDIFDDGKGIDPGAIKRKAYEKGIIDEATLDRITDREAVNLVFAAGFSTAEEISDLSGRGVGMDVVRTAVEKANGTILLESEVGKGTHIRISLPLSMAVTKVMLVKSDGRLFGVPMEYVVETVRVPRNAIRTIKHCQTTVLRGGIVPLKSLNARLMLSAEPKVSADDELAVLVARVGNELAGLIVDDFHETMDAIQKPLNGVLSGLTAFSGTALMGDGSVLLVLNVKEIM